MADAVADFSRLKLLPREQGIPFLDGRLHHIEYRVDSTGVLAGERITVRGVVPWDDIWQVLQLTVEDASGTGSVPNGWKFQGIRAVIRSMRSPTGVPGAQVVTGVCQDRSFRPFPVWERAWDGVTYLSWGETERDDDPLLIVQPANPVFSMHRWPAGFEFEVHSVGAETNCEAGVKYSVELIVLRFPRDMEVLPVGGGVRALGLLRDLALASLLRK